MGDWARDYPRQEWRRFLRKLGLPSCKEARIFASMIKPLKEMAEAQVGHTVTHGVGSFPHLVALYAEDVWDAFENAGLVFQQFMRWPDLMADYAANYASQGFSLCKDYKNKTACEVEQRELDDRKVSSTFNFHLSDTALMLSVPIISSPYFSMLFADTSFQDFNLGLRDRDFRGEEAYWKAIGIRLENSLMESKHIWENDIMSKVFVTGEGVYEERFVDLVKAICYHKGIDIEFFMEATTLTATGTAELAKRDLYLNPGRPHPTVS